jgi:hypothetical protein
MKLIDWLLNMEEINGNDLCPTYLYRWTVLRTPWFAIYLHHFVGDDWSRDLHDHPKRFLSIGLWGRYIEDTPERSKTFTAPWIRSFPPEHIHRIRLYEGEQCWTICIVFQAVRAWGFWHAGQWIPWRQYVGSETADRMKSCE